MGADSRPLHPPSDIMQPLWWFRQYDGVIGDADAASRSGCRLWDAGESGQKLNLLRIGWPKWTTYRNSCSAVSVMVEQNWGKQRQL
eukprot:scaffold69270_cov22-Cyclotella_meneghiniana.AAC.2